MADDIMTVRFDRKLCDQNPFCPAAKACPKGALFIDKKTYRPTFNEEECSDCGVCLSSCPRGAISEE